MFAFCHPFLECLRQERDGRDEEERETFIGHEALHELEAREGLPGAARHDKFPAISRLESGGDLRDRELLVFAQLLFRAQLYVVGLGQTELRPVHRRLIKIWTRRRVIGTCCSFNASSACLDQWSVVETTMRLANPVLPEAVKRNQCPPSAERSQDRKTCTELRSDSRCRAPARPDRSPYPSSPCDQANPATTKPRRTAQRREDPSSGTHESTAQTCRPNRDDHSPTARDRQGSAECSFRPLTPPASCQLNTRTTSRNKIAVFIHNANGLANNAAEGTRSCHYRRIHDPAKEKRTSPARRNPRGCTPANTPPAASRIRNLGESSSETRGCLHVER